MAVKASATITLTSYRDTQSVTRYYKLQPAGSSAPLKPETKPPSSDWTDSEPACDISKELYFCDLTIFSNGEGEYSKVSKSTSYEAAKEAYNKAQSAKDSIDNLEIGGRNYFSNKTDSAFNEANEFTLANFRNTGSFTQFRNLTVPMSYFVGKKCILSFDCISPNGSTPISVFNDNGRPRYQINTSGIISPINNEWIHQELIITVTDLGDSSSYNEAQSNKIEIYCSAQMGCKVRNVKLEIGDKATDWTPAPEDVDAGIANVQTGVDSLNDSVYGVQTFEYILDGVTIPVHKREDDTYYYILNDAEVDVAEANLVHDADGDLVSYQEGGINESLNDISNNIDTIDTKVDGFNAREDAIYKSIQDNSLIARKNARVEENSIIITNDTTTKELLNYLQLDADAITIYGEGDQIVTIAKYGGNSGYMEMAGTSLLIAQESRLSTIRLRSADRIGNLAFVAGSDGHVSLREVLD